MLLTDSLGEFDARSRVTTIEIEISIVSRKEKGRGVEILDQLGDRLAELKPR